MTRQRNSPQKKQQEEMTARNLINTDKSKMSELEFKITIMKSLPGFEKSIEHTRESLVIEIKELKSIQAELKMLEPRCKSEWSPQQQGWAKQWNRSMKLRGGSLKELIKMITPSQTYQKEKRKNPNK